MNNGLNEIPKEELLELYKEETEFIKFLEGLYKKGKEELEEINE
ncbi:MAG: hypothetical protein VZS44_03105 [Bacilli bacterium]|nr:hypothetical protein [Bacilli bacterium]